MSRGSWSGCSPSNRRHARGRDSSHGIRPLLSVIRWSMRTAFLLPAALSLLAVSTAHAQRPVRIGPTVSSIALQDANGNSQSYSSFGASIDLITGDDGESGLTISRYNDLSSNT